ncbi:MAG: diguanylate cyclase [Gammaproteobacteria bacterium]|nr:diguanylate cyclase [Gammaproteobacteria bacterium]
MQEQTDTINSLEWLFDIFRSIDVGVVIVEKDYSVKTWNSFMVNHSGVSSQDVINKNLFNAFPELPDAWLKRKIDSVFMLNTRSFITWEQHPYVFKFRSYRPITGTAEYMFQNVTLIPLHSTDGAVTHAGLVVYDVTDVAVSQIKLKSANQLLGKLSRTDKLTQLYNRGYWEESLDIEFERSKRSSQISTLVMFDIDHFKNVNDTYGHQAGDEVIRNASRTLLNNLRKTDVAGRYGGEEFAIILTNTEAHTALYFAERLRKKIESQIVAHDGVEIRYTISLGVAELSPEMDNHQQWIEAADSALYESKHAGRNRSEIYSKKTL